MGSPCDPCYQIDNMPSREMLSDRQTTIGGNLVIIANMATNIRRGARAHLYIEEWFKKRGLNDEKVGLRLGKDRATIHRWRKEQHRLNPEKIAALASVLDIEPEELWRPPADRSLDVVVKDSSKEVQDMAYDIVARMVGKAR